MESVNWTSWTDNLRRHSITVSTEHAVNGSARRSARKANLGPVELLLIDGEPTRMQQCSEPSAPQHFRANVVFQMHGRCTLTQHGRTAIVSPGDFAVFETGHPFDLHLDESFVQLLIGLPAEFMHLAGDVGDVSARLMPGTAGVSGMTSTFLAELADKVLTGLPNFYQLSNGVLNLLAAAVRELHDHDSPGAAETQGRALMLQIKAYIETRLSDPELSSASIARAHAISPRYLQKLFESEGTTATEWIRSRRLLHCSSDLLDPELSSTPIAAIAARWGMTDSSYFSRMFKAAFDVSPREYRSQATTIGTDAPTVRRPDYLPTIRG